MEDKYLNQIMQYKDKLDHCITFLTNLDPTVKSIYPQLYADDQQFYSTYITVTLSALALYLFNLNKSLSDDHKDIFNFIFDTDFKTSDLNNALLHQEKDPFEDIHTILELTKSIDLHLLKQAHEDRPSEEAPSFITHIALESFDLVYTIIHKLMTIYTSEDQTLSQQRSIAFITFESQAFDSLYQSFLDAKQTYDMSIDKALENFFHRFHHAAQ